MKISYAHAPVLVRDDIIAAHAVAWERIANPGTWFDGATRVAIAAETRNGLHCALYARRKQAVSPFGIVGPHHSLGTLPEHMVEQTHRIVTDPGRLTRTWYEQELASGTPETEYVEIVGVAVMGVSIDTFCRALGIAPHRLPAPFAGEPLQRRPTTAHQRGEAGVPMIHPKDLGGELATPEERKLAVYWRGVLANIRRALSLGPEEAYAWFQLVETQYLPGKAMRDFANEYRAITHAQIELIAGRVSVLNQCFY